MYYANVYCVIVVFLTVGDYQKWLFLIHFKQNRESTKGYLIMNAVITCINIIHFPVIFLNIKLIYLAII